MNPDDDALKIYRSHPQATVIPCTDHYWKHHFGKRPESLLDRQVVNVNQGALIAQSKGCTWITHIDCDELIPPQRALKAVLSSTKADVIRYQLLEAIGEQESYAHIFLPTLVRLKPRQWQAWSSKALGCSPVFYCGEYLRGHRSSKVLVRLSSRIKKHGIHQLNDHEVDMVFNESNELRLLNFDSIGIADWKAEFATRISEFPTIISIEKEFSPSSLKQVQDYIHAKNKGGTRIGFALSQEALHDSGANEKYSVRAWHAEDRVTESRRLAIY